MCVICAYCAQNMVHTDAKQTKKICWNCRSKTITSSCLCFSNKIISEKGYCNLHYSPSNEHRALLTNYCLETNWQALGSHFSVEHQLCHMHNSTALQWHKDPSFVLRWWWFWHMQENCICEYWAWTESFLFSFVFPVDTVKNCATRPCLYELQK